MTVPATTRKAGPFTGTGVNTPYPFSFKIFATTDVQLTQADTLGNTTVLSSGYSVTMNPDQVALPGGSVTLTTALPTGYKLTILGNLPYDQTLSIPGGGNFDPVSLEKELDRTIMQLQQVTERNSRAISSAATDALTTNDLPSALALALLGWNPAGTQLQNYVGGASSPVSPAMAPVVAAATLALGRAALGSGATGDALFLAATADAARSTLGLGSTDTPSFAGLNAGQLAGLRNRIINGDMRIDQRNSGAAVTPTTSPTFLTDRFGYFATQASKITFQQVVDAPAGFTYSLKATVASQFSPGAADYFSVYHPIEGQNVQDLQFGLATAKTITVSVWVKGSVAGTYSCWVQNSASNRSYIGSITITTSWAQQKVTLTADTSGTWLTDTGRGLAFGIDLGSGSNYNSTAGTWQAGNFVRTAGSVTFVNQTAGATLNTTGFQLELGSVATPFEQRPYGLELSLCQRYRFQMGGGVNSFQLRGYTAGGTSISQTIVFPAKMRTSPTVTIGSVTYSNASGLSFTANASHSTMSVNTTAIGDSYVTADASGITAFDAEL